MFITDRRLQLQTDLEGILGSTNVYFQPPENTQIKYPCIVYRRDRIDTIFAGNVPYNNDVRYLMTYIDRRPDSPMVDILAKLPKCQHDRFYTVDNLNHDVFKLYY